MMEKMEKLQEELKAMKNLFNFATKELSQDAFLRWFFESWQDEQLRLPVLTILNKFCSLHDGEEVERIQTQAQWKKIDIRIDVRTAQRNIIILIEDKTESAEHNQLKKYDEVIDKELDLRKNTIVKIFYKTGNIYQEEKKRIEEAKEWKEYDINKIYSLFYPFHSTNNLILKQYVESIQLIQEASTWSVRPTSHDGRVDLMKWEAYFKKLWSECGFEERYKAGGVWRAGQYPYICLVLKRRQYEPYIEIRSRDFFCESEEKKGNDCLIARILFYDVERGEWNKEIREKQERMRNIENSIFNSKGTREKHKPFPRQIGVYETIVVDDDSFKERLMVLGDYYDKLMEIWDQ